MKQVTDAASCSYIRSDDPVILAGMADPSEAADGDCGNKLAVDDKSGHGTHVASTVAAPVNGIGVAGIAPEATIVPLKACTSTGYCFVVGNQCRVLPAELPGAVNVTATGPVGYPGYTLEIADYSSVGSAEVAAPGGDYFRATGTAQDAVIGAVPMDSEIWAGFDPSTRRSPASPSSTRGRGTSTSTGPRWQRPTPRGSPP